MAIATINPATGERLKVFAPLTDQEIDRCLKHALEAFEQYRKTSFSERERWMLRAADILEDEKKEFGKLMTLEMGKPVRSAIEEVEKSARACRFYAENAAKFLADEPVATNASKSYVRFQPLGPVLAVMPWNFPFWQVFRFAAPALMAGNVGVLKHASNVPQCALAIEDVFRRAGFPSGVFQTFLVGSEAVRSMIESPEIKAVTLTGSTPAGASVASAAGKLIKKSVLELGGSDPFIVMPSASMEDAVRTAVRARTINNGQSCIAAKRFIIAEQIADEFQRGFIDGMQQLIVGDPMDEQTEIGPLATQDILNLLDEQVKASVALGAKVLTGGKKLTRNGNYYPPTILTSIPKNAPAYTEEIFGPVALLFRAKNIEEAVSIANDSIYGLGTAIAIRRREAIGLWKRIECVRHP